MAPYSRRKDEESLGGSVSFVGCCPPSARRSPRMLATRMSNEASNGLVLLWESAEKIQQVPADRIAQLRGGIAKRRRGHDSSTSGKFKTGFILVDSC